MNTISSNQSSLISEWFRIGTLQGIRTHWHGKLIFFFFIFVRSAQRKINRLKEIAFTLGCSGSCRFFMNYLLATEFVAARLCYCSPRMCVYQILQNIKRRRAIHAIQRRERAPEFFKVIASVLSLKLRSFENTYLFGLGVFVCVRVAFRSVVNNYLVFIEILAQRENRWFAIKINSQFWQNEKCSMRLECEFVWSETVSRNGSKRFLCRDRLVGLVSMFLLFLYTHAPTEKGSLGMRLFIPLVYLRMRWTN